MLSGNLLISSLQKVAVKLMLQEKYTYPEALIVYKIKKKHVSNKNEKHKIRTRKQDNFRKI